MSRLPTIEDLHAALLQQVRSDERRIDAGERGDAFQAFSQAVQRAFAKLDKSKDGQLSWREVKDLMAKAGYPRMPPEVSHGTRTRNEPPCGASRPSCLSPAVRCRAPKPQLAPARPR